MVRSDQAFGQGCLALLGFPDLGAKYLKWHGDKLAIGLAFDIFATAPRRSLNLS